MAFVDYEFYKGLYGADAIAEPNFNRFEFLAERVLRNVTTGVDGKCKLDFAYPENETDVEAIKRCLCEILHTMNGVNDAQIKAAGGGVISSVSAGNESISYATNSGIIGAVLSSKQAQDELYAKTADSYLRGVKDKNGVNILFRGVYPYIY